MYYLLLLIITIPAFVSLVNPWYFSMHDFQHVARLFLLDQGLRQGQLYVRWVDILGFNFGYPLFNFYPPLMYYSAELFRLVGMSYINAVKAVLMVGYIAGAWGMFLLMHQALSQEHKAGKLDSILTDAAAGVSAVLYTYFTYHAVLVYVRGAFAEFTGMAVLPFALWSLERLRQNRTSHTVILFAFLFALLLLAHPFVAVPFVFFTVLYYLFFVFITPEKIIFTLRLALSSLLGLALSAFFWLPSMLERKFTLVNDILLTELADFRIHFLHLTQLWYSPWGFGGSGKGYSDNMSFQLGKIHLFLAVISVILFIAFIMFKKKTGKEVLYRFVFFLTALVVSIIMMLEISLPVWNVAAPLQYLQFPWRLLTFTAVFISVIGSYCLFFLAHFLHKVKWAKVIIFGSAILISVSTVLIYGKYFKPERYLTINDSQLTSFSEISARVSRSSFEFAPQGVALRKSQYGTQTFDIEEKEVTPAAYQLSHPRASATQTVKTFTHKSFRVSAPEPLDFTLNTFNFPGWTAYVDGKKVKIDDNNRFKLITIGLEAGNHQLDFRFENTPVRFWANIISLSTASVIGLYLLTRIAKKKRK